MKKRLMCFSDRHDKFLVEESKRLDISVSGLLRGIIEAYIEKHVATQQVIINTRGGMDEPVECGLEHALV